MRKLRRGQGRAPLAVRGGSKAGRQRAVLGRPSGALLGRFVFSEKWEAAPPRARCRFPLAGCGAGGAGRGLGGVPAAGPGRGPGAPSPGAE